MINALSKVARHRISIDKLIAFLCAADKHTEKEVGEMIFTIASNKISCSNSNQESERLV